MEVLVGLGRSKTENLNSERTQELAATLCALLHHAAEVMLLPFIFAGYLLGSSEGFHVTYIDLN